MQAQFVVHHGMLAILEVLEAKPSREVILRLLRIINLVRLLCPPVAHLCARDGR